MPETWYWLRLFYSRIVLIIPVLWSKLAYFWRRADLGQDAGGTPSPPSSGGWRKDELPRIDGPGPVSYLRGTWLSSNHELSFWMIGVWEWLK